MNVHATLSRKEFLTSLFVASASCVFPMSVLQGEQQESDITLDDLKSFEKIVGIEFSEEERSQILNTVRSARRTYRSMRSKPVDNSVPHPTPFLPKPFEKKDFQNKKDLTVNNSSENLKDNDLAFATVAELSTLIKTKQIKSTFLTEFFLNRLETYGEKLLCVVNLTPELAMQQAKRADEEIEKGIYRGVLHGIPYGVKDLFATKKYPTTWGAEPFKDQVLDYDSGVVELMENAGAVLCAKLSMGALAQGDVWFKGRTKNPWNPQQGSSGSSAGSACAVAGGLLPFAIGTETLGSIVSPSHFCRVTGLRPTFGRVTRYGAMTLCYSMDKVGPICKTAEDCALVFHYLHGSDPRDNATFDYPFAWNPDVDLSKLKIGYLVLPNADLGDKSELNEHDYLKLLVELGAHPEPIKFDQSPDYVMTILGVESACAFDDFTLSEGIKNLKDSAWPNTFRVARYVPAVEYLRAMRKRSELMQSFERHFGDFDMFIAFERGGYTLAQTNLTGHPQILIPFGTNANGSQRSVSFIGRLYDEARLLAVAWKYQQKAGFWKLRPDLSKL